MKKRVKSMDQRSLWDSRNGEWRLRKRAGTIAGSGWKVGCIQLSLWGLELLAMTRSRVDSRAVSK